MKFTLNWLKDFLDTDASAEDIGATLTNIGLEVESQEDIGAALSDFVVAKIQSTHKHPDADKLQVCSVFDGDATRQIVCGAANARPDMYVVLAKEGVYIPNGNFTIKKATIRGVESNGMLCSFDELGIAGDASGIIELAGAPLPGSSAAAALGMDDVVFDIAITPNRGDCFCVYGIARDLAAAGLGTLKDAVVPQVAMQTPGAAPSNIQVAINTPKCTQFIGITVTGVKNTHSPDWLKQRLEMIGQKPISALVDITNYIMLTFGRPLHAYDVRAITGNVTARQARAGETITALNGVEYTLDEDITVIADDEKALGIAGIMGGNSSGCQADTTDVFIESALFDAVAIAQTGQKLNLTSDARMRFERGVDSAFVQSGAVLAASMIRAICGGELSAIVAAGTPTKVSNPIRFNPACISRLTSLEVAASTARNILESLGFTVVDNADVWHVNIPPHRHDIHYAEDLVEEVARMVGYDHIAPVSLPPTSLRALPSANQVAQRLGTARAILASQGLAELHSWTFISEAQAKDIGDVNPALVLANPISSELSVMRSSLLPHLLAAAERNLNKGTPSIAIFEVGQVFEGIDDDDQRMMAAGLFAGTHTNYRYSAEQFSAAKHAFSLYDAKAAALSVLSAYGVNVEQLSFTADAPAIYHPGRSMRISLGGKVTLAHAGELHPALVKSYGVEGVAAYFDIHIEHVPQAKQKSTTKKPLTLSPYPSVDRDFAFAVDEHTPVENMRRAALRADKKLIKSAVIFDVYQGEHMDVGQKSVALRITLEPYDATLTDAQINDVADAVIEAVSKATGAQLRA